MEGQIGGSMRAAARRITISGKITGKANLLARRIVIASGAVITGDLIYRGKEKPEIAEGARIGGQVRQIPIELSDLRSIGRTILGIGLVVGLAWALATLLLIVIVHLVFPHLMANSARNLADHPWSNLGRGIAIALVASGIAGLLMTSVFGIPLGSALFMAIGIAWLMGLAAISACISLYIRQWRRGSADNEQAGGQTLWAALGAVILGVVGLIPVIGWLVVGLAVAAGLGAASAELWQRLRHA
jgi:hypothetical protein